MGRYIVHPVHNFPKTVQNSTYGQLVLSGLWPLSNVLDFFFWKIIDPLDKVTVQRYFFGILCWIISTRIRHLCLYILDFTLVSDMTSNIECYFDVYTCIYFNVIQNNFELFFSNTLYVSFLLSGYSWWQESKRQRLRQS